MIADVGDVRFALVLHAATKCNTAPTTAIQVKPNERFNLFESHCMMVGFNLFGFCGLEAPNVAVQALARSA